jgi:hypothetical protein
MSRISMVGSLSSERSGEVLPAELGQDVRLGPIPDVLLPVHYVTS